MGLHAHIRCKDIPTWILCISVFIFGSGDPTQGTIHAKHMLPLSYPPPAPSCFSSPKFPFVSHSSLLKYHYLARILVINLIKKGVNKRVSHNASIKFLYLYIKSQVSRCSPKETLQWAGFLFVCFWLSGVKNQGESSAGKPSNTGKQSAVPLQWKGHQKQARHRCWKDNDQWPRVLLGLSTAPRTPTFQFIL